MAVDATPTLRVKRRNPQTAEEKDIPASAYSNGVEHAREDDSQESLLVRAASERELLEKMCRVVVEIGGHRLAWIRFAQHDEAKTVRVVGSAG